MLALASLLVSACTVERSLECLAPANPGGGWDLTCRAFAQIASESGLVDRAVQVRNVPGAGGGIAFAHVAAERVGDADVIVAASPATTLRLAQGQFGSLSASDVRWVGTVAADYGVIAVRADAPWATLDELLDAWRSTPGSIVAGGGSAVGGQDHMKLLLLGRAAGLALRGIRYVPFDGGGEALTSLLGGFVDVSTGDVSEVLSHVLAGNVRVLATLSRERLAGPLEHTPTASEQGYDVDWITWRGFYVPRGLDANAYERWRSLLESVRSAPGFEEFRVRRGLAQFAMDGDEFERFVTAQVEDFAALTAELGLTR